MSFSMAKSIGAGGECMCRVLGIGDGKDATVRPIVGIEIGKLA